MINEPNESVIALWVRPFYRSGVFFLFTSGVSSGVRVRCPGSHFSPGKTAHGEGSKEGMNSTIKSLLYEAFDDVTRDQGCWDARLRACLRIGSGEDLGEVLHE